MSVCITFAGPVGSSKTPIAHALSCEFGWPIFSNDAIRKEVSEDHLEYNFDRADYQRRRDQRLDKLITSRADFIYDASVDRKWEEFSAKFPSGSGYAVKVISLDLSLEYYLKLLKAKHYDDALARAKQLYADHQEFLTHYRDAVVCSITDETFHDRLVVAIRAVQQLTGDK